MREDGHPAFRSPPGGCDCHFHVFGAAQRYPYDATGLRYAPPLAPLGDYLAHARTLEAERARVRQIVAERRERRRVAQAGGVVRIALRRAEHVEVAIAAAGWRPKSGMAVLAHRATLPDVSATSPDASPPCAGRRSPDACRPRDPGLRRARFRSGPAHTHRDDR